MLVRHKFGPEGVAYLYSYLGSNRRFGKRFGRLLADLNLEAGTTSAFVPAGSSSEARVHFEVGGLFGRGRLDASSHSKAGVRGWLNGLLELPSRAPRVICIEDALMRRTDPVLDASPEAQLFFCGDDVYWYATAADLDDALLRPGAAWAPNVGVVTEMPTGRERIVQRESLSPHALHDMAACAVAVFVGAWDGEGFLLWEPAGVDEHLISGSLADGQVLAE